jgi:cation diffusion facilitator family transporter
VKWALQLSLATNVIIVLAMLFIAIASGSLALLSSLVENIIDTLVQTMLWWAGTNSKKVDYARYPAGKSRYEPVAVIIAACVMGICAVLVMQESIVRLVDGVLRQQIRTLHLTAPAIIVVSVGIGTKILLYLYCLRVVKMDKSSALEAITQDNRNDIISNTFAVLAFIAAAMYPTVWFLDPAGALLIFTFIVFSWVGTARSQVRGLVGVAADGEFVEHVKRLTADHHPQLTLDIIRAYHFGTKYLVELEVIMPAEMTVRVSHDIAMHLQFKLEQLEEVERAFVHVDYASRDYDEHVVSREHDALLRYIGITDNGLVVGSPTAYDTGSTALLSEV